LSSLAVRLIAVKDWAKTPSDHVDPYHLGLCEAFENNFDWICPQNLFSDLSEPKLDHKGGF
jgi:hypothetical protein